MARGVVSFDMGSRNLAYAQVYGEHELMRWGMIDLGRHNARQCCTNLVELLETEFRWVRDSHMDIVVELQPVNGTCKTLSHVMQAYFDMCNREDGGERKFVFMRAGDKLNYMPAIHKPTSKKDRGKRKQMAMAMTELVLAREDNEPEMAHFYQSFPYKQRTDLADALVQGCRYLQKIREGAKTSSSSGTQGVLGSFIDIE